jgi:hypothetical protein
MEACPAIFRAPMGRFLGVAVAWGLLPGRGLPAAGELGDLVWSWRSRGLGEYHAGDHVGVWRGVASRVIHGV